MIEDPNESFECPLCDERDEEYVCADTFDDDGDEDDDELVATAYRGLRDVDAWRRRDPWGGSAGHVPRRATSTNTFASIFYIIELS